MAAFLHTALRIIDPEASRRFYETIGMEVRREAPYVRDGVPETHYFFGFPGQGEVLQLTVIQDQGPYDLGTGYNHMAFQVDDLDGVLARLKEQGIEPDIPPFKVLEDSPFICFVSDPDGYSVELFGHT